jgi:hypothetical protein
MLLLRNNFYNKIKRKKNVNIHHSTMLNKKTKKTKKTKKQKKQKKQKNENFLN